MKRIILSIAFLSIVAAMCATLVSAQKKPAKMRKKLKEVNIFLLRKSGAESQNNLFPYKRLVKAGEPLHNALEVLTRGPTRHEKKSGAAASHFGLEYNCATLQSDGTAILRFSKPDDVKFPFNEEYGGEIVPQFVIKAIEQTAMQFPSVNKVIFCLDGDWISADGKSIDYCPGSRVN